ncbi:MAG TPA: HlyD family efflux transporter periplasmic adaptor subunit [Ottowia sp.]|nr:HlyD family efflux transporter periplasmic adaptor subunit [Ottowia sp.]
MLAPFTIDTGSHLLTLLHRARETTDTAALQFIVTNDTHLLAPYRQAALWRADGGVATLSGVAQVERNVPYVQWLQPLCKALADQPAGPVDAASLPARLTADWDEWWPAHALWLPFGDKSDRGGRGGLILARDEPWLEHEVALLADWTAHWHLIELAQSTQRRRQPLRWGRALRAPLLLGATAAALAAVGSLPVHLSVLAPAELVPANPVAVRAPMDGVVQRVLVKPNEAVRRGQPLFAFDDMALASRRAVAAQALATADTELRQTDQQSLYDNKARANLPAARGNVAEKRAELALIDQQLGRSQVLAPADGIALFDDPAEWTGKPVATGERVMRLAAAEDKEIEAWVALGDAIPLQPGARLRFYLSASPTESITATLRYMAHEAQRRPDGQQALRVRATLDAATPQRIGQKGTARLEGEEVKLGYWVLRRPLAAVREFLGL